MLVNGCEIDGYYHTVNFQSTPSASGWTNIIVMNCIIRGTINDGIDYHGIVWLPDKFTRINFQNCLFYAASANKPIFSGFDDSAATGNLYLGECYADDECDYLWRFNKSGADLDVYIGIAHV